MFDIGFSELVVCFGVSLVVLGPKKMPGLVKKVGRWVGKARTMARDFQQQLENEVNLEELNKLTNQVAREAQGVPEPPPEFTGAPVSPSYPYTAQDPSAPEATSAEAASADAAPAEAPATDDTYSHAHAAGDAPMADVAEHAATAPLPEAPVQADLDLSPQDDYSHLPPDDARRHS